MVALNATDLILSVLFDFKNLLFDCFFVIIFVKQRAQIIFIIIRPIFINIKYYFVSGLNLFFVVSDLIKRLIQDCFVWRRSEKWIKLQNIVQKLHHFLISIWKNIFEAYFDVPIRVKLRYIFFSDII